MRRTRWLVLAAALAAIAIVIHVRGVPPPTPTPRGDFSFGVFGDAPYLPDEALRYPFLLKHIDAHDLRFVIHVGDIFWHPCSDEHYAEVLRNFDRLHQPVVYTPGDNEWTDCWERDSGGFQPRERLNRIRQLFFANPRRSLGAHPMPLASQGGEVVENQRWSQDGVVFATVDLPGSRNGTKPFPGRTVADDDEVRRRTNAAAAWARAAFDEARAANARAVVLAFQANMGLEDSDHVERPAYEPFLATVKEESRRFGRPVLLAHGDGHVFIVDHPLRGIANVTRMQVPGSPDVGWVRIVVTPDTKFEFAQTIVPWWKVW